MSWGGRTQTGSEPQESAIRALQAGSLESGVTWAGCLLGLRGARCRQWLHRVQMPLLTCVFQIILVSSSLSDRDQSLFLSADEGATFQKQLVPFSVETLIFHPQEEDKVLAYAKEGKVSRPGSPEGREPPHHPSPGSPGRQEGSAGLGPGPPQPLLPGAGVGDPITPAPGAGVGDPLSPCSPGLGPGPHHPLLSGAGAGDPITPCSPGLGLGIPSAPDPWGRVVRCPSEAHGFK